MATLKSQIQGLIDYANETTGAGDTLLGDAVKTLCDGYGQGGGGDDRFKEVTCLLNSEGFNREVFARRAQFSDGTLGSANDTGNVSRLNEVPPKENDGNDVAPNREYTVIFYLVDGPRYIAYTRFPSAGAFPVAHIGGLFFYGNNAFTSLKSLRNINSNIRHIFDLQALADEYVPSITPLGRHVLPGLAFRSRDNMGNIYGCNDLAKLQAFLDSLS